MSTPANHGQSEIKTPDVPTISKQTSFTGKRNFTASQMEDHFAHRPLLAHTPMSFPNPMLPNPMFVSPMFANPMLPNPMLSNLDPPPPKHSNTDDPQLLSMPYFIPNNPMIPNYMKMQSKPGWNPMMESITGNKEVDHVMALTPSTECDLLSSPMMIDASFHQQQEMRKSLMKARKLIRKELREEMEQKAREIEKESKSSSTSSSVESLCNLNVNQQGTQSKLRIKKIERRIKRVVGIMLRKSEKTVDRRRKRKERERNSVLSRMKRVLRDEELRWMVFDILKVHAVLMCYLSIVDAQWSVLNV